VKAVILVGMGGFAGSILRYLVHLGVQRGFGQAWLPYATLFVNVAGCFLIGVLIGLADARNALSPEWRWALVVGLLGSFTTYSTFSYEILAFLHDERFGAALLHVGLHLALGLLAVWAGHSLMN
jgi:fluoride exporter